MHYYFKYEVILILIFMNCRTLDDRLQVTSPDVIHEVQGGNNEMSPAERRALEAEKRKQWRQAR